MREPVDDRIPEKVPPLPLPGFEYDNLEREERIGTGGDADVYRATIVHNGYTYPVALKEPRFDGTIQKRVVEKFRTEAETWSRLSDHENIVSVYAWGAEPLPWLALEFMDGGTLDKRIGSLDLAEALWLSGRIAEGVRYGHRHGIAHLDIKPTNVLLRDTPEDKWDYPKVSDWGLAKMLLEHSNSIDGISPTYAAPEQFDAEGYGSPDDITDIYQLGALVYALVAGEPPFTGPSTAVMQGVLQEDPDPPSKINSAVPAAVDAVVLKALSKEKHDRYDGVLTFRQELDELFEEYATGEREMPNSSGILAKSKSTDKTTERETDSIENNTEVDEQRNSSAIPQAGSSSVGSDEENSSSRSSIEQTDNDDSSLVSRRHAVEVLGLGVLASGGWMAMEMTGNDNESTATTETTDSQTGDSIETDSSTGDSTETESSTDDTTEGDTSEAESTTDNGVPVSTEYTFEEDLESWEPVWHNYNGGCRDLNDLQHESGQNVIEGSGSAMFHTSCDSNLCASPDFIIDPSVDFTVSVDFYFEDPDHRGLRMSLYESSRNGSEDGERVEVSDFSHGLAYAQRTLNHGKLIWAHEEKTEVPDGTIAPETTHTLVATKSNGTVSASLNGTTYTQQSIDNVSWDPEKSYRLLFSASGAYGSETRIWFDSISITH